VSGSFRFEQFDLDLGDRQLRNGGSAVELNSRYFDALALLVSQQGRLVSKDREFPGSRPRQRDAGRTRRHDGSA